MALRETVIKKKTRGVSFIVMNGKTTTVRGGKSTQMRIDPTKLASRTKDIQLQVVTVLPESEALPKESFVEPAPIIEQVTSVTPSVRAEKPEPLDIEDMVFIQKEKEKKRAYNKKENKQEFNPPKIKEDDEF